MSLRLWLRLRRPLDGAGSRMDEIPSMLSLMLSGISLVYLQSLSEGVNSGSQLNFDKAGLRGELVRLGRRGVGPGRRQQIRLEVLPPVLPRRDLQDVTGTAGTAGTAGTVLNWELLVVQLCWPQYVTWFRWWRLHLHLNQAGGLGQFSLDSNVILLLALFTGLHLNTERLFQRLGSVCLIIIVLVLVNN